MRRPVPRPAPTFPTTGSPQPEKSHVRGRKGSGVYAAPPNPRILGPREHDYICALQTSQRMDAPGTPGSSNSSLSLRLQEGFSRTTEREEGALDFPRERSHQVRRVVLSQWEGQGTGLGSGRKQKDFLVLMVWAFSLLPTPQHPVNRQSLHVQDRGPQDPKPQRSPLGLGQGPGSCYSPWHLQGHMDGASPDRGSISVHQVLL